MWYHRHIARSAVHYNYVFYNNRVTITSHTNDKASRSRSTHTVKVREEEELCRKCGFLTFASERILSFLPRNLWIVEVQEEYDDLYISSPGLAIGEIWGRRASGLPVFLLVGHRLSVYCSTLNLYIIYGYE